MTHNRNLLFFWLLVTLPCLSAAQSPTADCSHALFLCDKSPLVIKELLDAGKQDETADLPCLKTAFAETNSIWLTWQVAESGTLEFSILPMDAQNDVDFVLYRLKSPGDCTGKETLRCMAAGPSLGEADPQPGACTGATGLRSTSVGNNQSAGCNTGADNFLSPAMMQQGEYYALWINNFRSKGGLVVEWGGTANFKRDEKYCSTVFTEAPQTKDISKATIQFSPLWPDPATSRISTTVRSPTQAEGNLWVMDEQGRILYSRSISLPSGESALSAETSLLPTGIYFLKICLGDTVWLSRFLKE